MNESVCSAIKNYGAIKIYYVNIFVAKIVNEFGISHTNVSFFWIQNYIIHISKIMFSFF